VGRPDGCITQLSILEGHYLGVHHVRPDGRACQYQFDLRFADPTAVRVRQLAWGWLVAAAVLAAFGVGALESAWPGGGSVSGRGIIDGALATFASILALYVAYRRTTESMELRCTEEDAALVSVTGAIGSARRHRQAFVEFTKYIDAARLARPQPRQQFLRDEMREHYRLRQVGVVGDQEHEASKVKILAAHRPGK